uniref:Uncharacterized protein n=1 Tax=Cyclopterus lumpus TaxID=8103 RepID=A0A8C2ZPP0_CYCLU
IYKFTYDLWKGTVFYLEAIYILQEFHGKMFIKCCYMRLNTSHVLFLSSTSRASILVADNNSMTIEFYKGRGAADPSAEEGWHLFEIEKKDLLN